jgi:hypothetical protein
LLYELNKNTIVKVRIALGETKEAETGEGLGQGTNERALISASSIDYTVDEHFKESHYEISYDELLLQPLLFQDDVARLCLDPEAAQMGNYKMESVMESKLLDFNMDKSCYMVVGGNKAQMKMKARLNDQPLTLCNFPMKNVESEKYLGDQISAGGLAESVQLTVDLRAGKVTVNVYEIKAILEDCRIHCLGGIMAGLEMWETAVIPKLLYNSEVWTDIKKVTLEKLENLQNEFLRAVLATPRSTPTPSLCWETGTSSMENRIIVSKLLFYHHLLNLDEDSLASQVASIQMKHGYPGLMSECGRLVTELGLPNIRNVCLSKLKWRKLVKELKNKDHILQAIRAGQYKKLNIEELCGETFETKPYLKELSMSDARLFFQSWAKMLRTIKVNFKNHPQYLKEVWMLPS